MLVLILILAAFTLLIMLLTYLNRRKKNNEAPIEINYNEECCGAHVVCERDSLLNKDLNIEYFDDEELDTLANIPPDKMTESQTAMIEEVFYTLKESDVAAWLRSLQLRHIELPASLREQALLIVSERR
jgi:hypothetical protein